MHSRSPFDQPGVKQEQSPPFPQDPVLISHNNHTPHSQSPLNGLIRTILPHMVARSPPILVQNESKTKDQG